jgi:hypothetical protein
MEYTWKVSGCHANWQMTLAIDPPDNLDTTDLTCWKAADLEGLANHFQESVHLWEMYEELERLSVRPRR